MISKATRRFAPHGEEQTPSMKNGGVTSTNNDDNSGIRLVNPFNLKECDAGFQQYADLHAATTRTEMSTDLDDVSVQQRFSFASTSLYNANGGPSASYALSFDSNTAKCPSTTGRIPENVDVITTGSHEVVSQLTGPKEMRSDVYEQSLFDLDEDDPFASPKNCPSWGESMFIGTDDALDTESKMNFYTVPNTMRDGVDTTAVRKILRGVHSPGSMFNADGSELDTESKLGFYKQESLMMTSNTCTSVNTESRDDFNVVNETEEPPSCREKMRPVLSFSDEDEFEWLAQSTMKIEAKKKEEKRTMMECGNNGSRVASILRSFIFKCGSCFLPP